MDIDIEVKNYRCFSDAKPLRFTSMAVGSEVRSDFPSPQWADHESGRALGNEAGTFALRESLQRAFKALADTLYIGAFRNVLNVGEMQEYFDIQIGQAFVKQWKVFKS